LRQTDNADLSLPGNANQFGITKVLSHTRAFGDNQEYLPFPSQKKSGQK